MAIAKSNSEFNIIYQILDIARWAPSGDNTQPWRFKILSKDQFLVIFHEPFQDNFYDIDHNFSYISMGCLVESIRLAANKFNKTMDWEIDETAKVLTIKINLQDTDKNTNNELADYITVRSVNRDPYLKEDIPKHIFDTIQKELDEGYKLRIVTDQPSKKKIIKLNMLSSQIRMLSKDAHEVHKKIISFDQGNVPFGISYMNLGLSQSTLKFMKIFFNKWKLSYFLNRYLLGATLASYETEYIPGVNSSGFWILESTKSLDEMGAKEFIETGMQIQRIWLFLTKENIATQPCFSGILTSYHFRNHKEKFESKEIYSKLKNINSYFDSIGFSPSTHFIARYGNLKSPPPNEFRSVRLPLNDLILP